MGWGVNTQGDNIECRFDIFGKGQCSVNTFGLCDPLQATVGQRDGY